jgi:hypothetical protein
LKPNRTTLPRTTGESHQAHFNAAIKAQALIQLNSIDGTGLTLAVTIMLGTNSINTFDQVGNFNSYCRCVIGARHSNGKNKSSTNTKNEDMYLA